MTVLRCFYEGLIKALKIQFNISETKLTYVLATDLIRELKPMMPIKKLFGNKYWEIILSVTIFVIVDSGILGLNFYITTQLDYDAHAIGIANRQKTLSEEMLKALYAVHLDVKTPDANYMKTIDSLEAPFKQFDETLDSMIYGGKLIGSGQQGDNLFSQTDYLEINKHELLKLEELWKSHRLLLMPIVHAYFNDYTRSDIEERTQKAIDFSKANQTEISSLLSALSNNIETTTRNKVQTIRKIQAAGIVLAVANFVIILFHFIRKLSRSDKAAEKAEHEIREILGSVSNGLFLLDKQLAIGDQHSASLKDILPADNFSGRNFIDVMRPYVTEKTLGTVKEYVELLFTSHVEESLIQDLNPLQEVTIHIDSKGGAFDMRHLQFMFRRSWDRMNLNHVLVSITDVTEAVQLRDALKKSEQKSEADMAMLTAILHLDPDTLDGFIRTSKETLDQINQVFRHPGRNPKILAEKLGKIQKLAHKLKGDCSMIDLRFLLDRVHNFEERLVKLQDKETLGGDDFVGPAVELEKLMRDLSAIQGLTSRIGKFSAISQSSNDALENQNIWSAQLRAMANTIARDEGKKVELLWIGQPIEDLPSHIKTSVQDTIVQCTRNAICHGIETPDERQAIGKAEIGLVQVILQQEKDCIKVGIRDDGAGIDLKKIRTKALEKKIMSAEKLDELDSNKLISMIFHPNFSTAGNGLHAGRGIGMSLVRDILQKNKAAVSIKQRANGHTEFFFRFPTMEIKKSATVSLNNDLFSREAI